MERSFGCWNFPPKNGLFGVLVGTQFGFFLCTESFLFECIAELEALVSWGSVTSLSEIIFQSWYGPPSLPCPPRLFNAQAFQLLDGKYYTSSLRSLGDITYHNVQTSCPRAKKLCVLFLEKRRKEKKRDAPSLLGGRTCSTASPQWMNTKLQSITFIQSVPVYPRTYLLGPNRNLHRWLFEGSDTQTASLQTNFPTRICLITSHLSLAWPRTSDDVVM